MGCQEGTRTKCYVALFNACYQLVSMTFFCMIVPYLYLVLHASYSQIGLVLGGSLLIDCVCSQLLRVLTCCKKSTECISRVFVFVWVAVMILSSMLFFTIHIWLDVDNGDLKTFTIALAALFCSLARFSFTSFMSSLKPYLVPKEIAGYPGLFLGAAIWTGILWLPIDFLTEAHWLFGVTSIIVFSFTCLILFDICCSRCLPPEDQRLLSSTSLTEETKTSCCETDGNFGCLGWSSLFLVFLFNVSISPISYFLIDWQIRSCNNGTCFQVPYLGLNNINYPLRTYWLLSVTSAVGYFGLSVIEELCNVSRKLELPVTILAMATFDVALFAIGYTGNQPWWTILLFISQGFYRLSFLFVKNLVMDILKVDKSSSNPGGLIQTLLFSLPMIGQIIGILLISFILEKFDYITLFKILGVLVLLTWILMITLHIIRDRMLKPVNYVRLEARPPMIFKKSVKLA